MQPLKLTLKGFRGIRDGLGLDEITLDLERLADDAELIAIAGANGSGKTHDHGQSRAIHRASESCRERRARRLLRTMTMSTCPRA